jgi:prepilin peptidase CpaA
LIEAAASADASRRHGSQMKFPDLVINLAMLHSIILFAAATALLFAAAHDVAVRTVPNPVSLIVAMAGLGLNLLDGQLLPALFDATLVFAGAWFCWRRGWIGGGDVKLLTACVLLMPQAAVPAMLLGTALAGGLLALGYVLLARFMTTFAVPESVSPNRLMATGIKSTGVTPLPASFIGRVWRAERRRIRRGLSLPYSCAIAAGALLTLYVNVD